MLDLPALTQIIGNGETPVRCTKCNCTYTITKFQQFLVISFLNEHSFWQYLGLHRMRIVVNKRSTLHTHTITESHASNLSSCLWQWLRIRSLTWAVLQHQQLALGNMKTRTVWCWRPTEILLQNSCYFLQLFQCQRAQDVDLWADRKNRTDS